MPPGAGNVTALERQVGQRANGLDVVGLKDQRAVEGRHCLVVLSGGHERTPQRIVHVDIAAVALDRTCQRADRFGGAPGQSLAFAEQDCRLQAAVAHPLQIVDLPDGRVVLVGG